MYTLGHHLARRLVEIHVTDVFTNPGDLNQTLLDHLLIAEPGLKLVKCPDELYASYLANGYAMARKVAAFVVTFTSHRELKLLNAIASAYTENLPVLCIVVGGPPPEYDYDYVSKELSRVTCYQAVVNNLEDAHELIDTAISTALEKRKIVYIGIGSKLPPIPHPSFTQQPLPLSSLAPKLSNKRDLAPELLNKVVNTEFVGKVKKAKIVKPCQWTKQQIVVALNP